MSKDNAPERIYVDAARVRQWDDANATVCSTEHAINPTDDDVLYIRADIVRAKIKRIVPTPTSHFFGLAEIADLRALLSKLGEA